MTDRCPETEERSNVSFDVYLLIFNKRVDWFDAAGFLVYWCVPCHLQPIIYLIINLYKYLSIESNK